MSRHTFYLPPEFFRSGKIIISGQDAFHISRVLRLKTGSSLHGITYDRRRLEMQIERTGKEIICRITGEETIKQQKKFFISLALSCPRPAVLDSLVPKLAELGCDLVQPLVTERCFSPSLAKFASGRYDRIAAQAVKHSGRTDPFLIKNPVALNDFLNSTGPEYPGWNKFFPYEGETENSLARSLEQTGNKAVFVIGPEGGFSCAEADKIKQAGFIPVSLGSNILKVETAALFALISFINRQCS
ncbi:MAG: hypothetical protein A2096_16295 [Spirochaetes bacterium GWF1_41_5]|nr:MAG: hypothetical protein A2096_16295 [Spirochaetes bacterium GWF1_41_5]HBE04570.1 hypothetical protein [Spirochaetia bacterium]